MTHIPNNDKDHRGFLADGAPLDDVDRLFGRLSAAPVPIDLTASILASTTGASARAAQPALARRAGAWPWLLPACLAIVLLAVSGYALGSFVADPDTVDLLAALGSDLSLLLIAPTDTLAAVAEVVPWPPFLLAGLTAALLVWCAGKIQTASSITSSRRLAATA